jgi:hypothetical protein
MSDRNRDREPPRDWRRDVDADIAKYREQLKENDLQEARNKRMRLLFGGTENERGFAGFGRTDKEIESTREHRRGINRALNDALNYRRMYPDEVPVGSPGRPNLMYKKGGAVKKMASGGRVRGDGCAIRGKTKGKVV